MITIELPEDIQKPLADAARRRGTTPEQLVVETLRLLFPGNGQAPPTPAPASMYDYLSDLIGSVEGSGRPRSDKGVAEFTDHLVDKKKRGKL